MYMFRNPLAELDRIQQDMDSLFNRLGRRSRSYPSVNLYDTDEAIYAEVVIPGMKKEDITIQFENGTLQVKGERKKDDATEGYEQLRAERNVGAFSRSIEVPVPITVSDVKADLKNGVLTITMPKSEEAKPKQISIN